jgi:hypothetical protein
LLTASSLYYSRAKRHPFKCRHQWRTTRYREPLKTSNQSRYRGQSSAPIFSADPPATSEQQQQSDD